MKRHILETVVFVCGAATMVLELVGSRLLAPYLGTSLFVWTSLIGVILGCLSVGYWWGGKISDRKPDARVFASIIFSAALFVGAVAFFNEIVLAGVQSVVSDIRLGAVIATLILFGVPSVLLGMVLPYAVRLKITTLEKTGSTVGSLYAISTVGSILGTFLAGFFLISYFGHTAVLLIVCAVLIFASVLSNAKSLIKFKAALILFFIFSATQTNSFCEILKGSDFIDVNTAYNRVCIYKAYHRVTGWPVRVMQVNDESDSVMYTDHEGLAADYTQYYRLARHFCPSLKRSLMIGGAAYSYPKDYLEKFPDAQMDVVEIDPKLTALAKKYFNLKDDPRLAIFHEDARTFLNKTQNKYDVIYGDAFRSFSIPFQLTTREAVAKIYGALDEDGVLMVNIISAVEGDKGQFLRAEVATLKLYFPQIYLFAVTNAEDGSLVQNIMVVALKSKKRPKYYSEDVELNKYLQHLWIKDIKEDMPVLTDDYAPVDRYALAMIGDFVRPVNPVRERIKALFKKQ